ncbi:MAG TPA: hypothetical protein VMR06_03510 [Dokdonella sp.]|uniref:hypothetical protein n=1 Tax=Dokdonella sp. TaxID=2291710 RepID=UPI002D1AAA37|nr:hypothetical protein [Dokdonella sp.]HUD41045.1 hypothetical protein [Dokdonella sp.]
MLRPPFPACRPVSPAIAVLACALALGLAGTAAAEAPLLLRELPYAGLGAPQPSRVTGDGTVYGADMTSGNTLRWLPDAAAAEDLGGGPTFGLINVTPLANPDGSTVVANYMREDGKLLVSNPRVYEGIFGWTILSGMDQISSLAMGLSRDGSQVVGYGGDPDLPFQPWQWDADRGQRMLPVPAGMDGGEAWAASDDGRIVGGHVSVLGTDEWGWPTRYLYGARWVDGAIELLEDGGGHTLGQVVACNADCTVLIGGGYGGEPDPHPDRGRAWYWTEAEGAVYLDTSGLPAGAMAPYYAMAISADGAVIVGTYTEQTETPFGIVVVNKPFRWTREGGAESLIERIAAAGYAFGGEGWELVANSVSTDGRHVLLNGMDADYALHGAVLTFDRDGLFADGFD